MTPLEIAGIGLLAVLGAIGLGVTIRRAPEDLPGLQLGESPIPAPMLALRPGVTWRR